MKFLLEKRPRLLSLNAFSWDETSFSRLFQGWKDNSGFLTIWQQKVFPYFIKETGQYYPIQAETTATTTVVGSSSHNLTGVTPNRKRKQSLTLPSLTPASKTLRLDLEDVSEEPSDEEMDERIKKHSLGES